MKQLKGKTKKKPAILTKQLEWQKWKLIYNPFPSLVPTDFEYYDNGEEDENEDGQEHNIVELKHSGSYNFFDSLQSGVDSDVYELPE